MKNGNSNAKQSNQTDKGVDEMVFTAMMREMNVNYKQTKKNSNRNNFSFHCKMVLILSSREAVKQFISMHKISKTQRSVRF